MREPIDEFAARLRKLRKRERWTASKLSQEARVNRSYIGQWERGEAKTINLSVLREVCDALNLSGAEERELFHLAEIRNSKGRAIPRTEIDPELNLVEALMDVDQRNNAPGFDAPPVKSELTESFAEAASWLLAYWAARHGPDEFDYRLINWGDGAISELVGMDMVSNSTEYSIGSVRDVKQYPYGTTQVERATIKQVELHKNLLANFVAGGYRRWLFQRLERCRECALRLEYWALFRTPMQPVAKFIFKNAADHGLSVQGVSCDVITKVNQRRLAGFIASQSSTTGEFIHIPDRVDTWPRTLAAWPKRMLDQLSDKKLSRNALLSHLQIVADSKYALVDHETWSAKWWIQDWHTPFLTTPGSERRGLNLQREDDREELIHRLKRVERRIHKQLKSKKSTGASEGFPRDQEAEWEAFCRGE